MLFDDLRDDRCDGEGSSWLSTMKFAEMKGSRATCGCVSNGCRSMPLAQLVKDLYDPDQKMIILGAQPPGWPEHQFTLQERSPR